MNLHPYLLSALCLLLLASCGKDASKEVESEEVGASCLAIENDNFIINSEEDLLRVLEDPQCPDLNVDFSTQTLLGQYAEGSGCNISFDRAVYVNEDDNAYRFVVTVKQRGLCEMLGFSMNWVTVPKIDEAATVQFAVE